MCFFLCCGDSDFNRCVCRGSEKLTLEKVLKFTVKKIEQIKLENWPKKYNLSYCKIQILSCWIKLNTHFIFGG